MNLYIKIEAHAADDFSITAAGRDREICQRLESNLILATYPRDRRSPRQASRAAILKIENEIPIGKGCGSSAAARLAGIALANHFGRLQWSEAQIIGEASRREHHADNASACWMGGLTIARMSGTEEAQVVAIRPKGKWPLLLAVPEQPLATEQARSVLPAQYSRADAVVNIQNSMLLLAAFTQGRPDLLSAALEDRIHQPYRAPFCPLLSRLKELTGSKGIVGAALSGSGPSVLVFLDPRVSTQGTRTSVASHLSRHQLRAELLPAAISSRGAGS